MPKAERKIILIGDQLPEPDVVAMARLIVQVAHDRQATSRPPLAAITQPAMPNAEAAS
jgi:hypothetical protein